MKTLRSFIPPLAAMLMTASGGASAQGVLIDKSEIRFLVAKQARGNVEGRFRKWKANVDFRPRRLADSRAAFEIDLASIDLASEEWESQARRPIWFDTATFPVASFASSEVRSLGGNRYEFAGTLSVKGVDKDVVVPIVLTRDSAGNSVAEGQFTLNRLEFGIGEGLVADNGGIGDEVTIRVRMVLPTVG